MLKYTFEFMLSSFELKGYFVVKKNGVTASIKVFQYTNSINPNPLMYKRKLY